MILDEVLQEVYIPNVPATEKMVSEFAKMAKVEVSKDPQKVKALIKELRDTFKEFTNANRVEVEIDDMGSCFTIPPQYNPPPKFTLSKKGIQFTNNNNVYICINVNPKWIFKCKTHDDIGLNPRELTAILLHEIGHNFSHSVIPIHDLLETIKLAIQLRNMETLQMNSDGELKSVDGIKSVLKQNLQKILDNSSGMIENGKLLFSGLLSSLSTVNRERYLDEKIADSFATTFGFGKDLSSGLSKLDRYFLRNANKDSTLLGGVLLGSLSMAIIVLFDEHPQDVTRMHSQIEQLEYELENNSGLSKKDKEQMRKDIRGIKTVISQYNTITKSDKFTLPWKLYSNFLTTVFGGEELMTKITKYLVNPKMLDLAYKRNA